MRVLYIEDAPGFGGSLTGLIELIRHLPGDVEASLACSFDAADYASRTSRIYCEHIKLPKRANSSGGIARNLWQYYWKSFSPWCKELERLIPRIRPDVIHCNNSFVGNYAAATVGKKFSIATIAHEKGFAHSDRFSRWLARNSRFDLHLGTSPAVSRHLSDLGVPPSKLVTMFEPVPAPLNPLTAIERTTPIIGMHSMLTPWKGQAVFLRAIGLLNRECQHPFRVILAGSSLEKDAGYENELHQIVAKEGISHLVEFRGHVANIPELLRELDIAVHASIAPEPFGRVVAEAMVCGVLVVVSDAGGPAEYVEDGVTGFHSPMGDSEALARLLAKLLADPGRRRAVGEAGRKFASTTFDPMRLGKEMVDLYRRLLANCSRLRGSCKNICSASAGP